MSCDNIFNTFSGCVIVTLTTLVLSTIVICVKFCYKSKCKKCNFCNMIKIERDTEKEELDICDSKINIGSLS
jgi:hypothetical protein